MLNIDGFSQPSIDFVNEMLYAEGQINPYEGKCNQKQLREQAQKPRTPAQQEADRSERKLLVVDKTFQLPLVRKQQRKRRKLDGGARVEEAVQVQPPRVKYKKHSNYYVSYSYQKHSSLSAKDWFHP
jgi:hypothetical protein